MSVPVIVPGPLPARLEITNKTDPDFIYKFDILLNIEFWHEFCSLKYCIEILLILANEFFGTPFNYVPMAVACPWAWLYQTGPSPFTLVKSLIFICQTLWIVYFL